jgi:hypothetical protein
LHWSGENDRAQILSAEIWMHHKGSKVAQKLEASLFFFRPLRLRRGLEYLGTLTPRDLPRAVEVIFFSSTRASLAVTAEAVTPEALADTDPFVVNPPIPLSREECENLQNETNASEATAGPVMCAYRVPVTLHPKVKDRYFDTGPFRRLVRLVPHGPGLEETLVPVTGTIESDVQVGSKEQNGRVQFGSFARSTGTKKKGITIYSDDPDISLELDRTRIPVHLEVNFEETSKPGAARRTWRLEVSVPPYKASGVFPRDGDPAYRDSDVYLKSSGASNRLLRIPVEGNADNR